VRQMIRKFVVLALAMAACLVGSTHGADPQKPIEKKQSVFLIGNSLTWDTEPKKLDGDVQWHVDCGKSLPYIHDHPGKPCVKSSKIWTKALKQKQYDILSIQPHYGTSLKKDVDTISKWMAMQPKAVIVIHTGWAHSKTQAKEFANKNISGDMQHSPVYFDALLAELKKKHPRREIRRTRAMDLLAKVAQDIQAGKAPFKDVKDLYRDPIHMKLDTGRYLMHNAMRYALGQPASSKGYEKIDPKLKAYLDATLAGLTVND
jgi:hypothetical protein